MYIVPINITYLVLCTKKNIWKRKVSVSHILIYVVKLAQLIQINFIKTPETHVYVTSATQYGSTTQRPYFKPKWEKLFQSKRRRQSTLRSREPTTQRLYVL